MSTPSAPLVQRSVSATTRTHPWRSDRVGTVCRPGGSFTLYRPASTVTGRSTAANDLPSAGSSAPAIVTLVPLSRAHGAPMIGPSHVISARNLGSDAGAFVSVIRSLAVEKIFD